MNDLQSMTAVFNSVPRLYTSACMHACIQYIYPIAVTLELRASSILMYSAVPRMEGPAYYSACEARRVPHYCYHYCYY